MLLPSLYTNNRAFLHVEGMGDVGLGAVLSVMQPCVRDGLGLIE